MAEAESRETERRFPYPQPPAWTSDSVQFVNRLQDSGIRIRALRLTDAQIADHERFTGGPARTLWGYPVERR